MAILLQSDVKPEGMSQSDLFAVLANLRDVVNELQADHATARTVDTDMKALANSVRSWLTGNALVSGLPAMAIVSNFDAKVTNALLVKFGAVTVTVADDAVIDTGTAATFPATKWGIFRVSADNAGALTATWATGIDDVGYDDEAEAIAALPATPAGEVSLGYVTVEAHATEAFIAGTDALETGTGGNVANATNYYNETAADIDAVIAAAVTSSPPAALAASTAIKLTSG